MQLPETQAYRKALLPKWIRFFSWGFLILASALPFVFAVGMIWPDNFSLYFLGLFFSGPPYHPFAVLVQLLMLLFGVTAYGFLWGRRWAIHYGILCGFLASLIPISTTVNGFLHSRITIEFSFLFAIPFLIKLFKIRDKWLALEVPDRHAMMKPG